MKFSVDQQKAIDVKGSNALISAAAGSGKTAVLTQRIVEKLLNGIDVENLIVLTFTNASAKDMKNKIYKAVSQYEQLDSQLKKISTSNICTFDSYALKIVKQYGYLIGLDKDPIIADTSIFEFKKKEILTEIMEQYINNECFKLLLRKYSVYNISKVFNQVLKMHSKIQNLISFEFNINDYHNKDYESFFSKIKDELKFKIYECVSELEREMIDEQSSKFIEKIINQFDEFENNFQEITFPKKTVSTKIENKNEINKILQKLDTKLCEYKNYNIKSYSQYEEENKNNFIYNEIVYEIILDLEKKLNCFKTEISMYEFSDIKKMAIKIFEQNPNITNEIKLSTNEILLDEYQDTDDIQEYFVSLISNNNIYMVGDIKQSIYRFRYANPDIFISKFNNYKNENGGKLISLSNNYRSNNEVISAVNDIFDPLMSLEVGGVEYDDTQKLVYSNKMFEIQNEIDYSMSMYNYEYLKDSGIAKTENEAIIVVKDIINKIQNNFEVVKNGKLEKLTYSDICILCRSKTEFDVFKKVFESFSVPLMVYSDTMFKSSYDVILINNLLKIVNNLNKTGDFKYILMSYLRSYLNDYNDDDIHLVISKYNLNISLIENIKNFNLNHDIFFNLNNLKNFINLKQLTQLIINKFDFLKYSQKLEDGELSFERLVKVSQLASQFDSANYTLNEYIYYLDNVGNREFEKDISFENTTSNLNVCQMMTIHKSKGLEFSLVYVVKIDKKFKFKADYSSMYFDKDLGFIFDLVNDDYTFDNYLKFINMYKDKVSIISEEMRLLYVALTRAQSKLILIGNFSCEMKFKVEKVSDADKNNINSFKDMLDLISYNLNKYVTDVCITYDDIQIIKNKKLKEIKNSTEKLNLESSEFLFTRENKIRASKSTIDIFSIEEKNNINRGNYLHQVFESLNFNNVNRSLYTSKELKYIDNLCEHFFIKEGIDFYQEFEFIKNETSSIIDLLVESKDVIYIVDFKTSSIDDPEYEKQMQYYFEYIKSKYNKKIVCILYSIYKNEYKQFNFQD